MPNWRWKGRISQLYEAAFIIHLLGDQPANLKDAQRDGIADIQDARATHFQGPERQGRYIIDGGRMETARTFISQGNCRALIEHPPNEPPFAWMLRANSVNGAGPQDGDRLRGIFQQQSFNRDFARRIGRGDQARRSGASRGLDRAIQADRIPAPRRACTPWHRDTRLPTR